ncbi:hypothetical protein [Chitinophaga silvisoli]|uniref:DUF4919 domain-containing protein n=1 Tax=Chitinophaga silvisoli TaxID=2291814 RepID=A0A3E1P2Q6_9BACT|nr:hypothetical protein [Chitinophaga silvisoli]RFM34476.1 hypothetical protein DXN04_14465 [Chitinophaga silvisoli]
MKKTFLFLVFLLFANTTNTFAQSLGEQLRTFRDAVYQRDKAKTKQFFKLPISDPGPHFWTAASMNAKGTTQTHLEKLAEKHYPLTEELFTLYFDQIFHKKFITSFLKLKTKDLQEIGETSTPEFSDDQINFYYMLAKYDADTGKLTLSIIGHSKGGEDENGGEYAYIYQFNIVNGQLRFDNLSMAG